MGLAAQLLGFMMFHVFFAQCHKPSPRSTSTVSPKNPPQMVAAIARWQQVLPRAAVHLDTGAMQQVVQNAKGPPQKAAAQSCSGAVDLSVSFSM